MRKQLLLGTTALLAGAVAAPNFAAAEDPLRLEVRGYKNEFFGIGDIDDDTEAARGVEWGSTSHFSDGEVHFKGETALDNGLTVGVDVQLEAFGATGDDIDEAYSYIQGDFGRLVIGSENLADYTTFFGVTAPSVGIPINSGWITAWVPAPLGNTLSFRSPGLTTNVTLTNDTFQISYLSPRFAGFQFVAGYAPTDASRAGDPKSGVTDELNEINNIIGVGANYAASFNGFDLGVAAGYERGTADDVTEAAGADDPQLFKVGASVGFAGFTIAGSYADVFEDWQLATGVSEEGSAWDAGVSYATGPWGVSASYQHGEEEAAVAVAGEDEVDSIVGAVSYALGPGITTSLSGLYTKWENEDGAESEGLMGILGLAISF